MPAVATRLFLGVFAGVAVAVSALAAAPGPVALKTRQPLAKTVAAFPRVVGGTSKAAAALINKALAGAEDVGCGGVKGYWNRSVTATMRGPHYLSLVARDDYYCGTAYPDTDTIPLVFDLATGAPIDWKPLFAAGVVEASGAEPGDDASTPVTVTSAVLWKLYAKRAVSDSGNKDCAQVFDDPPWHGTGLMLWPDAEAGGVTMMAADFPRVIKACGPPITLTMPALRKLRAQPALLAAIAEAHRNGWFDRTKK